MLAYTFEQYKEAGCPETVPTRTGDRCMVELVIEVCEGRVCVQGCWAYAQGRCKAFKELTKGEQNQKPELFQHTKVQGKFVHDEKTRRIFTSMDIVTPEKKVYDETVKQEAARTGLSLSEVRRRRNQPTNS